MVKKLGTPPKISFKWSNFVKDISNLNLLGSSKLIYIKRGESVEPVATV